MGNMVPHWINGEETHGTSGRDGPIYDPATGAEVRRVTYANAQDVDLAVASARNAFPDWRDTPLAKRTQIMFSFRSLVDAAKDELAELISSEHGKT